MERLLSGQGPLCNHSISSKGNWAPFEAPGRDCCHRQGTKLLLLLKCLSASFEVCSFEVLSLGIGYLQSFRLSRVRAGMGTK